MENTHSVSLGGETILVNPENFRENVDALVARYGGVPKVVKIEDATPAAVVVPPAPAPVMETQVSMPAPEVKRGETVSASGAARSEDDKLAAQLSGFAPKQTIYTRGTMVVELGVDNARLSRVEHDKKPLTEDACTSLIDVIDAEKRIDRIFQVSDLRMSKTGALMAPSQFGPNLAEVGSMGERAFKSFLARTDIGGADYLSRIPPMLRSTNINHWMTGRDGLTIPEGEIKLRTRRGREGREIFAAVSPKYTSFDVDRIAHELRTAIKGTGARGSVVYDGEQARFEAIWHTDVQPEEFVCGEFFKAGIVITSADDGRGSCRVSAVVWQNLCLNLIVIDEAEQELARIRHTGSEQRISDTLRAAFDAAKDKVGHFVKKWGYACRDDARTLNTETCAQGLVSLEEALPGFFNGIIERDLVPVRGKRQDVVRALVAMHDKDQSSATMHAPVTRASLANAFTRYAHEVNGSLWQEEAIQRGAGKLVQLTGTIPFEAIDIKGDAS